MNQTSYLQNSPLLCLCHHPIPSTPPLLPWLNLPVSPPASRSPSLSLLLQPERRRFFDGLWLQGWFSIKPLWHKEPSDFLTGKICTSEQINNCGPLCYFYSTDSNHFTCYMFHLIHFVIRHYYTGYYIYCELLWTYFSFYQDNDYYNINFCATMSQWCYWY